MRGGQQFKPHAGTLARKPKNRLISASARQLVWDSAIVSADEVQKPKDKVKLEGGSGDRQ